MLIVILNMVCLVGSAASAILAHRYARQAQFYAAAARDEASRSFVDNLAAVSAAAAAERAAWPVTVVDGPPDMGGAGG